MKSRAGGLFEVVWFVMGGLMLFMGIDVLQKSGIGDSWHYFLFSLLSFVMYYFRRRMRINAGKP